MPAAQPGGRLDLTGTLWNLSTLMRREFVAGSGITAEFTSDGKLSGSSGCNLYTGGYRVKGNSILISWLLSSRKKACSQEIIDQETAYLETLAIARLVTASMDRLTLKDADGNNLMTFSAQTQDLAGTYWEVTSYNNGEQAAISVPAGTTITAQFASDGSLFGNSSCNDYSGPYKISGDQITIGPLVSTKKACADPAGLMDQEAQYLAALGSAATYKIEGKVLELRTADGALAVDYTKK